MAAEVIPTSVSEELERCEAVIERGFRTFVEVGTALERIREARLYRARHGTFEDYCHERWGMSRVHAHRMIEAAVVAKNLLPIGNIPAAESQARPLAPLKPEQQRAAWTEAVATAPNGKPTAAHVAAVVEDLFPRRDPLDGQDAFDFDAEPPAPDDADPDPDIFACVDCGEEFDAPVWHCPECGQHQPAADEGEFHLCAACHPPARNGHAVTAPKAPASAQAVDVVDGWLPFWERINLYLVTVPRQGGVVNMARGWPKDHVKNTVTRLRLTAATFEEFSDELEKEYLDDEA